jgi:hypothetical protein
MLDHDNQEDYLDPQIYDSENGDFGPDGPFYLELARQVGSSTVTVVVASVPHITSG